jgi:hypothetical protein
MSRRKHDGNRHKKMIISHFRSSGEYWQTGEISESALAFENPQEYYAGAVPDNSYHDFASRGPVSKGLRPSAKHTFSYVTKQWEDQRTLADVKAAKNSAINQARAVANSATFTFQGKLIEVDQLSRSDIDGAHGDWLIGQAPVDWPGGWKTLDNSYVAIPDQATWFLFYKAMVAQGTANFNHSQVLKAQLEAASTVEEVEQVPDW